jgi:hypothetical protein
MIWILRKNKAGTQQSKTEVLYAYYIMAADCIQFFNFMPSSEIWKIMSEFDQIYANDFTLLLVWKREHKTTYSKFTASWMYVYIIWQQWRFNVANIYVACVTA